MFRLRGQVFADRLGWAVQLRDGLEYDAFDRLECTYILARSPDHGIVGCWRLLPTTGPYMLRDTFAQLLQGRDTPTHPQVWELSRFAVATDRVGTSSLGFGPMAVELMAESLRFAVRRGITQYVTVTTVGVERLLKRQGIHMRRMGPPMAIGVETAVACQIEIDPTTLDAVGVTLPCLPELSVC